MALHKCVFLLNGIRREIVGEDGNRFLKGFWLDEKFEMAGYVNGVWDGKWLIPPNKIEHVENMSE